MSKPNIVELQNLLEKTTKGDWKVENDGGASDNYIITNSEDVDVIASIMSQGESFVIGDLSDLEFIVKAKNNLPALFKYIEELETKSIAHRLRAENEKLRVALKPFAIDIARSSDPEYDRYHAMTQNNCSRALKALEG